MPRVAINGLGRIGKLLLRAFADGGMPGEIVLLNDPVGDAAQHAHLLEFDTVHGRWPGRVEAGEGEIILDGTPIRLTAARALSDLPLAEMGVELVVDCTGVFKTGAKIAPYFEAGVEKVVVS
ncbi:MAG: glyceraldehyde 3-phosphate dehydrogenase NAD-binding domain-containing protein, partial [Pseudomonadota bacterium]